MVNLDDDTDEVAEFSVLGALHDAEVAVPMGHGRCGKR